MIAEERIVDAVLLPGEVLENGKKTADISVEIVALLGEKEPPAYQIVATVLDGRRFEYWASCVYDLPLLASTEYFRHTDEWVNPEDYEEIVSGRTEWEGQ